MLGSMETVLLRVKRGGARVWEDPTLRALSAGAACFGGGMVLSGMQLWGRMQPAAVGLVTRFRGWRCCAAAVGCAAGYLLFWGRAGWQGAAWVLGAFILALLTPAKQPRLWLASLSICMVAGISLIFGSGGLILGGTVLAASLSALLAAWDSPLTKYLTWGAGVMALGCRSPNLAALAGGFGAAALPLPGALAVSLGADLGSGWYFLTLGTSLNYYLSRIFPGKECCRGASLAASLVLLMLITQNRQWQLLLLAVLGGWAGALVPLPAPRRGRVGAAQVQLEGAARVLTRLQRQLLDWVSPPPDVAGLTEELRRGTCGVCPCRTGCMEQKTMTAEMLEGDAPFLCRKSAAVMPELSSTRKMLKRMHLFRAKQEEYRLALVQQYGFLADALRELADRLPGLHPARPRYRVQVSARSRSKQESDGDRVSAFAAPGGKFYVLLCDGMGTGSEAAAESREAAGLMTQMLRSGLSPGAALGSVNSQLALTGRGGAVTVDLAELHPDTGRVWLYKWGAQPSWLIRRRRGVEVGSSGPPPGLGVTQGRESVSRVHLLPGDTLLLLSDGIGTANASAWARIACDTPPGDLAAQILRTSAQPDDATAVVIRMKRKEA